MGKSKSDRSLVRELDQAISIRLNPVLSESVENKLGLAGLAGAVQAACDLLERAIARY